MIIPGKNTIRANRTIHAMKKGTIPRNTTSGGTPATPATTKALMPIGGVSSATSDRKTIIIIHAIGSNPTPVRSGYTIGRVTPLQFQMRTASWGFMVSDYPTCSPVLAWRGPVLAWRGLSAIHSILKWSQLKDILFLTQSPLFLRVRTNLGRPFGCLNYVPSLFRSKFTLRFSATQLNFFL